MNGPFTLRGFHPADLEAMYELDTLCFEQPFRFSRSTLRAVVGSRGSKVFVVTAQGRPAQIVAFCACRTKRARSGSTCYIDTLDVHPSYRRLGLGRLLMNAAEVYAAQLRARSMALHLFAENIAARELYRQIGFVAIREELDFYGPGLRATLLTKLLVHSEPDVSPQSTSDGKP